MIVSSEILQIHDRTTSSAMFGNPLHFRNVRIGEERHASSGIKINLEGSSIAQAVMEDGRES